jgi:hypothetical protein
MNARVEGHGRPPGVAYGFTRPSHPEVCRASAERGGTRNEVSAIVRGGHADRRRRELLAR